MHHVQIWHLKYTHVCIFLCVYVCNRTSGRRVNVVLKKMNWWLVHSLKLLNILKSLWILIRRKNVLRVIILCVTQTQYTHILAVSSLL